MTQNTIARAIRVLNLGDAKKLTGAKLSTAWDYRADGHTLKSAQAAIGVEIARQRAVRMERYKQRIRRAAMPAAGRYAEALARGRALAENYPEKLAQAGPLADVVEKTSAAYPYCRPLFRVGNVLGQVTFLVDEDWHYYAKSYGKPKTTITEKQVVFTYSSVRYRRTDEGHIHVSLHTSEHFVARFAGNWFFDVLAAEFGRHKVEKSLKRVQLHPCFQVVKLREIAGIQVFARQVANTVYDYCVVAGGETFHAPSIAAAIAGLREKRQARVDFDSEILTAEFAGMKCRVNGVTFCATGVRNFMADNGIEATTITRRELRAIVVKNRATNCAKYAADLCKIGISLNCK